MMGISAVVATYKRKDELVRLLTSIQANNYKYFQVIIVDQNTDGLIDDVIDEYSSLVDIQHIKQPEANQSRARNQGALLAKYPVICFPDDDCWYDHDSIQKIIKYFQQHDETDLLIINWKQNPEYNTESRWILKKDIYSFRSVGYATIVLYFKRDVFLSLGGFAETIGIGKYIGGSEDSEITFRAASEGMKIYYHSTIQINHFYIPTKQKDVRVVRTRERGMGMLWSAYDVPYYIIFRGIISPLIRMMVTGDLKKSKQYFAIFRGRLEGFVYTTLNRRKMFRKSAENLVLPSEAVKEFPLTGA